MATSRASSSRSSRRPRRHDRVRGARCRLGIGPPSTTAVAQALRASRSRADGGHPLIGPIEVRGARAGQTLVIQIEEVTVGSWGHRRWRVEHTPQREARRRLGGRPGRSSGSSIRAPAAHGIVRGARCACGRSSVLGMPPAEFGVHSDDPAPGVRREHRLQGACGYHALPPDPGRGRTFSAGDRLAAQGTARCRSSRSRPRSSAPARSWTCATTSRFRLLSRGLRTPG